jgi:hypothetical protein
MPDLRQFAPLSPQASPSRGSPGRRLSPLARDIIVILIVKAIVLYLLWFAFFRTPTAPGMTMDPVVVEQRVFAPTPQPELPRER